MKKILAGLAFLALIGSAQAQNYGSSPSYVPQSLLFTGGPIATLAAGTGNNTLTDGTYATPTALTGGSGTGATATFVVTGCPGACSVAATIVSGGAAIGPTGATGYLVGNIVTVPGATFLGSSTVSLAVSTVSAYSYVATKSVYLVDGCNGGGGGGGGGATGSAAGGGGGGSGACESGVPLNVTPGATITITVPAGGLAGAANSNGGDGGTLTITGTNTVFSLVGTGQGGRGTTGVTGGTGGIGQLGSQAPTSNAAAAAVGSDAAPYVRTGAGGAGGGSTASNGAHGGRAFLFGFDAGAPGTGNAAGAGGASSLFGNGGIGGNNTPTAGAAPTIGYGGGGGGGGPSNTDNTGGGGAGAPGFAMLR